MQLATEINDSSMAQIGQRADPSDASLKRLLEVSCIVLQQAVDLIDKFLSHDAQLTTQSKFMPGSTIGESCSLIQSTCNTLTPPNLSGKHLRHARDHFMILLDAMSAPSPPYILNYDSRSRNTPMESGLQAARNALTETMARLEDVVPRLRMDEPVILNAITPDPQTFHSTFGREVSPRFHLQAVPFPFLT